MSDKIQHKIQSIIEKYLTYPTIFNKNIIIIIKMQDKEELLE